MLGPTDYHPVPVADAWDETPALRGVRLLLPPALAAQHTVPGQVLKVKTAPGEGFFALASAPSVDGSVELLFKRGGKVADAALAEAVPGGDLSVTAPFGRGFPIAPALGHDVLLFAAGSGISPIRALLQALLRRSGIQGRWPASLDAGPESRSAGVTPPREPAPLRITSRP